MGREPPPDARVDLELAQLGPGRGRGPSATAGGPVDHTEQWARRQRHAVRQPGGELLEPELVHARFAAFTAFPALCRGGGYAEATPPVIV